MNTEKFIAAARACLGTPFHPQGRSVGGGLDCAGLIIIAAAAAGVTLHDTPAYDMPPSAATLLHGLTQNNLTPQAFIVPSALLLFRIGGQPQHMAIASGSDSMIHAYAPAGRVVETNIGPAWHSRLIGIFTFDHQIHDQLTKE